MQRRGQVVVAATAGLLLCAVLAATARMGPVANPSLRTVNPMPTQAGATQSAESMRPVPSSTPRPDTGHHSTLPAHLLLVVLVAAVLTVAVLVLLRARKLVSGRHELREATAPATDAAAVAQPFDEQFVDEVHESFSQALQRLRTGDALDDAILECWRRLEDAAAASGVPRLPSQTSSEFTLALLSATSARHDDLDTLASLYRRAMFSTAAPAEGDRARAVDALERLAAALGQPRNPRPRAASASPSGDPGNPASRADPGGAR